MRLGHWTQWVAVAALAASLVVMSMLYDGDVVVLLVALVVLGISCVGLWLFASIKGWWADDD